MTAFQTDVGPRAATYQAAGVASAGEALGPLAEAVQRTFAYNAKHPPRLPLGYFANVLPLTREVAIAISTDGVGTKLLIAQELEKYDTVGIDCVAMNANDVVCVGAEPISMVDYLAVETADAELLGQIGEGLRRGAELAGINIAGGEVAQVREMIRGVRPGRGFDLAGTCIGTVHPDRIIIGQDINPGDAVVGLASSGIHSNGLTLARHILFQRAELKLSQHVADLGTTVGEELLRPTAIYVKAVVEMLAARLRIKALVHVTGDGFLNLARVQAEAGCVIEEPLPAQPIFSLIQRCGDVADAEMFSVFNMGTGFCLVVDPADASSVEEIARRHHHRTAVIGRTVADPLRRIWIPKLGLVGEATRFRRTSTPPPV